MADRRAAGGAGETAVGDQGDRAVQTHAGQGAGRRQHFAHAGAALRSFKTDDDDVAGFDLAAEDRFADFFFTVEDTGRPLMAPSFPAGRRLF